MADAPYYESNIRLSIIPTKGDLTPGLTGTALDLLNEAFTLLMGQYALTLKHDIMHVCGAVPNYPSIRGDVAQPNSLELVLNHVHDMMRFESAFTEWRNVINARLKQSFITGADYHVYGEKSRLLDTFAVDILLEMEHFHRYEVPAGKTELILKGCLPQILTEQNISLFVRPAQKRFDMNNTLVRESFASSLRHDALVNTFCLSVKQVRKVEP